MPIQKKANHHFNIPVIFVTIIAVFYVLYIWSNIIIPFIIALLFSLAIIWLWKYYNKIHYKEYYLPKFLWYTFSIFTYIFIFWLIWKIISTNVDELLSWNKLQLYQTQIETLIFSSFDYLWIQRPASVTQLFNSINFSNLFQSFVGGIASIFGNAWIIFFFTLFILLEYRYFRKKLKLMIKTKYKRDEVFRVLDRAKTDIKTYFIIKTVISFFVWLLSYIVLLLFGIQFAVLWAFLLFLFNFIPNVGSIIAVLVVLTFSILEVSWIPQFLFLALSLIWVQVLMWNFIEPKFMWNKLNLSPLVIIASLIFWWSLWWVVWMLLSVPIMVIINIVLARIPATHSIAILLSEKWDIDLLTTNVKKKKTVIKRARKTTTKASKK